jgi:hypothetical protein
MTKGCRPFHGLDFLRRLPGVPLADSLHPRLYASAHFAGWESFDLRLASGKSWQENKKLSVCFTENTEVNAEDFKLGHDLRSNHQRKDLDS